MSDCQSCELLRAKLAAQDGEREALLESANEWLQKAAQMRIEDGNVGALETLEDCANEILNALPAKPAQQEEWRCPKCNDTLAGEGCLSCAYKRTKPAQQEAPVATGSARSTIDIGPRWHGGFGRKPDPAQPQPSAPAEATPWKRCWASITTHGKSADYIDTCNLRDGHDGDHQRCGRPCPLLGDYCPDCGVNGKEPPVDEAPAEATPRPLLDRANEELYSVGPDEPGHEEALRKALGLLIQWAEEREGGAKDG